MASGYTSNHTIPIHANTLFCKSRYPFSSCRRQCKTPLKGAENLCIGEFRNSEKGLVQSVAISALWTYFSLGNLTTRQIKAMNRWVQSSLIKPLKRLNTWTIDSLTSIGRNSACNQAKGHRIANSGKYSDLLHICSAENCNHPPVRVSKLAFELMIFHALPVPVLVGWPPKQNIFSPPGLKSGSSALEFDTICYNFMQSPCDPETVGVIMKPFACVCLLTNWEK